jgi:hypothetical protein
VACINLGLDRIHGWATENTVLDIRLRKRRRISWFAKKLSAFQQGLCTTDLSSTGDDSKGKITENSVKMRFSGAWCRAMWRTGTSVVAQHAAHVFQEQNSSPPINEHKLLDWRHPDVLRFNIKMIKQLTSNTSYFIVCEATCFGPYVTIIRPSYESSQ